MKLHDFAQAPNPRRVRIFLAEKGIEVPRVAVDLRKREQISPEFLAKNPFGIVPVLELEDGTCISESIAICRYLEALHPEPALFGRSALEIGTIEMWNRRVELYGLLAVAGVLRNWSPFFADRALPGPEPVAQLPALAERERGAVARFLTLMDEHLARTPFVAGQSYSVADITLLVTIELAGRCEIRDIPDNVQRWHRDMIARPSHTA